MLNRVFQDFFPPLLTCLMSDAQRTDIAPSSFYRSLIAMMIVGNIVSNLWIALCMKLEEGTVAAAFYHFPLQHKHTRVCLIHKGCVTDQLTYVYFNEAFY